MKRIAILFACIFALSSCENQQVIHILSSPSELDWLTVTAYAGEYAMPGGASVEPAFQSSVLDYTAYVDKDTTHFVIDAGINSEGTVVVYGDQVTGDATTHFDLLGDEAVVTVKATRQYMETTEYRVTVIRGEPVPTARDVEISVEPGIAAFFIGAGVIPTIKVTAVPPGVGVAMNYQWYVNDQNNTRTGNPITGAEEDSYTMQAIETMTERSVYYYVEITTVFEGKTGITQSAPCRVTFLNKNDLDPRSYTMVDIPAGAVALSEMNTWGLDGNYFDDFITPGFKMGQCPVTWELWETVFKYADGANFRFAREGNQGGAFMGLIYGTNTNLAPWPVGNALNPVTFISWRDVLVWCNAYSEMDGLDPVYRDSEGNILRDSRKIIDYLVDYDAIENVQYNYRNGYRLPSYQEWVYAARGANPTDSHWDDRVPGINTGDVNVAGKYLWALSPEVAPGGVKQTGEVGKLLPNSIGLYDMMGMVNHWIDMPFYQQTRQENVCIGGDFNDISIPTYAGALTNIKRISLGDICRYTDEFVGFRVARNRGE